jgi:hypothetical protein
MGDVDDRIEFDVGWVLQVIVLHHLVRLTVVSLITPFSNLHILFLCQQVLVGQFYTD